MHTVLDDDKSLVISIRYEYGAHVPDGRRTSKEREIVVDCPAVVRSIAQSAENESE